MSDKERKIKRMIAMQKQFIRDINENGFSPEDYYNPSDDHPLKAYKAEFDELAKAVIDAAHAERGSER